MTALKGFILAGIVIYVTLLAILFFMQRRMMYLPDIRRIAPAAAGFASAQAHEIKTSDNETLVAWFAAPADGKPLIVYFHGNAGQLADRAGRFVKLAQDGTGLLAVSYRGYGGSSGSPTEVGLLADAKAAYDLALKSGVSPERIVLMGESLGTGIAIALATQVKAGALVLEAPFTSAADIAATTYWMFPVRYLMRDQFRSDLHMRNVHMPVMFIHGTADNVIPVKFGERLFALANEPKLFLRVENEGHQPLDQDRTLKQSNDWLAVTLH